MFPYSRKDSVFLETPVLNHHNKHSFKEKSLINEKSGCFYTLKLFPH